MQNSVYFDFIKELKGSILHSRYMAARLVNRELLLLYFHTGKQFSEKIESEKWGAKVLETISNDLQNELSGLRGFSVTSLKKMRQFYQTYAFLEYRPSATAQLPQKNEIGPLSTAQLKLSVKNLQNVVKQSNYPFGSPNSQQIDSLASASFIDTFLSLPFSHHILLLNKVRNWDALSFYMNKAVENQWTVDFLTHHIDADSFQKAGQIQSNFEKTLPAKLNPNVLQAFRDEYLLDFLNIQPIDEEDELVLENEIILNIKKFIMSLGREFTYMGNQYRLIVDEKEYFVDLLFYHRSLQALVAFELKTGAFKPEYAGKLNFYLSALDEYIKLPHENPSVGIILCKEKKTTTVEFSFRSIDKPMGVATYKLSKELPEVYKKYLPDPDVLRKMI